MSRPRGRFTIKSPTWGQSQASNPLPLPALPPPTGFTLIGALAIQHSYSKLCVEIKVMHVCIHVCIPEQMDNNLWRSIPAQRSILQTQTVQSALFPHCQLHFLQYPPLLYNNEYLNMIERNMILLKYQRQTIQEPIKHKP